jgi:hypothetical protein
MKRTHKAWAPGKQQDRDRLQYSGSNAPLRHHRSTWHFSHWLGSSINSSIKFSVVILLAGSRSSYESLFCPRLREFLANMPASKGLLLAPRCRERGMAAPAGTAAKGCRSALQIGERSRHLASSSCIPATAKTMLQYASRARGILRLTPFHVHLGHQATKGSPLFHPK